MESTDYFQLNIGSTITDETARADYLLALNLRKHVNVRCKYFTHPNGKSPSEHFAFANNPGLIDCSSREKKKVTVSVEPYLVCSHIHSHSSCEHSFPDIKIVSKYAISESFFLYLTRYITFEGNIFYFIYDSYSHLLSTLKYLASDFSGDREHLFTRDNLDQEASNVFSSFISDYLSTSENITLTSPISFGVIKTKKSYFSTILSN